MDSSFMWAWIGQTMFAKKFVNTVNFSQWAVDSDAEEAPKALSGQN